MRNKLIIITGHYGAGKTNVSINLALKYSTEGYKVTIVDMDIVNPYFRTADAVDLFKKHGIKFIIPEFANTNVDIPTLPAEIYSTFEPADNELVIYDVGGDGDGATALAMYKQYFENCGYDMWCVCNMYRPLIANPIDAAALISNMEKKSRLKCTGIINNSNLSVETTDDTIIDSFGYIDKISELTGLPIILQSAFNHILKDDNNIFHMMNVTKNIYGGQINE